MTTKNYDKVSCLTASDRDAFNKSIAYMLAVSFGSPASQAKRSAAFRRDLKAS